MRSPAPHAAQRHAQGVALIEVLVAMLVFSLGVLALVGLQGSMVRAQTDSKIRADAAYLASEVIGKMWSDLTNIAAYNQTACTTQTSCKEWQDKVALSLPSGTGEVEVNADQDVKVTLKWTTPNGGGQHSYVTHTTIAK